MAQKLFYIFSCCLLLVFPGYVYGQEARTLPRRGLLVSLVQNPPVLSSRHEIKKLIDFSKKADIQILFVQVYRAGKAWFPASRADTQAYETAFKMVQEDPFSFLMRQAHQAGIEVHAWVNMLSLSANAEAPILRKYGSDILTQDRQNKKTLSEYKIDDQYFLEPGDPRVRKELLWLVREILLAYPDLDGIQFDYIRYPDTHPVYGYAPENLRRFQQATGIFDPEEKNLIWQDWKRQQVTELLKMLVDQARTIRPRIQASATGCMPYARAYYEAFQDWPSWLERGLVDFVTAMNYSVIPDEYAKRNEAIKAKTRQFHKVFLGVGAYKSASTVSVFEEEFYSCEQSGARGCVFFHYGSFLENSTLEKFLFKTPQVPENASLFPALQALSLGPSPSRGIFVQTSRREHNLSDLKKS